MSLDFGASARPFLRWAGGKGQLLEELDKYVPKKFGRYFEPFLGAGALFYHLESTGRIQSAILSDLKLLASGHMSPMEHVGMAMTKEHWNSFALARAGAWIRDRVPVGNFWGWGQFRKGIPLEHDFSLLKDR